MEKTKLLNIALDEWIASLPSRDRSREHIESNFCDLFQSWKDIDATFEDVYDALLPKAIRAHMPPSHVVRNCYKTLKRTIPKFDKTEKEFVEEWSKGIESVAFKAFTNFFPSPVKKSQTQTMHGNMSASEYRAQRRYADQFPILDTSELEERWHQQQYNLDLEDMMKNVLGEKDEINSGTD